MKELALCFLKVIAIIIMVARGFFTQRVGGDGVSVDVCMWVSFIS